MHTTIFGTGYVGLVQAAVLAEVGHDVLCVDVDAGKIAQLQRGEVAIYEPGLERLVRDNIAAGRLRFTTEAAAGVDHADLQFIAVGTPPGEDGSADLQYVLTVAGTIGTHMQRHKIVVIKSTVPVGTCEQVRQTIADCLAIRGMTLAVDIASNPEFLKEGSAVADCTRPDRIIIGTASDVAERTLRELYAPFNRNHEKIIVMDERSAELTKYAANAILATKISFMNEMANIADRLGADIEKVRHGIGADPRIGYDFIYPGAGYGGSCFPKDVKALLRTAGRIGFEPLLLRAVEERNERQKRFLFGKISDHFGGELRGRTFALWGLAFKPETDDMREAPSRVLLEALWAAGAKVQAYDPKAMAECRRLYGERDDLMLCDTEKAALAGCDALIVITEWKAFKAPNFRAIAAALKQPVIFDGRNLYDPAIVRQYGITLYGVGR